MDRRNFIKSTALVSGAVLSPFTILAQESKLKVGVVGTGWWGTDMLIPAMAHTGMFEIAAICDVNTAQMDKAIEKLSSLSVTNVKKFKDYRDLFEMKGLDAVIIATPIHWHALQVIDACKKGLHVFMEKPVFYDIREGQMMMEAAKKAGVVVQIDFERVQFDAFKEAQKFIQDGKAGTIYQIEAQINYDGKGYNVVEKDIPATLDYDMWCGPAPKLPYLCPSNSELMNWRAVGGYCHGHLYDWGIHNINSIRQIMNLGIPNSVTAMGGNTRYHTTDTPDYLQVKFDFEKLPVIWHHQLWGSKSLTAETDNSSIFYGDKATVLLRDFGWAVTPVGEGERQVFGKLYDDYTNFLVTIENQFKEFVVAIKSKSLQGLSSPLEDAFKTTATVNLANIAYRTQSKIDFDSNSMKIVNNEKANSLLKREYRKPYVHPYKG